MARRNWDLEYLISSQISDRAVARFIACRL